VIPIRFDLIRDLRFVSGTTWQLVVQLYGPEWVVTPLNTPASGTFHITWGERTDAIEFDATAAEFREALERAHGGTFTVAKTAGPVWTFLPSDWLRLKYLDPIPTAKWDDLGSPSSISIEPKPYNLAGWGASLDVMNKWGGTILAAFRESPSAGQGTVTMGGTAGTISLEYPHTAAEDDTWQYGVYDLKLTDPDGRVHRLLDGQVKASLEATD
jgi:hypothetical protein